LAAHPNFVIGKVGRGAAVHGLLRYLFGPGRANEHTNPHLVGCWDGEPTLIDPVTSDGRHDIKTLANLLEQPVLVSARPPAKPVWHCSLRTAPADRRLTDREWAQVASEVVHRTGFATRGDDGGCRWVAVRHADDHVHLVVTLARQDGRRVSTSNDFYRVGEACRWAEQRYGLTLTAGRDRTAPKRPTRAEAEKATRAKDKEPARIRLQREVRTAAAASTHPDTFLAQLKSAGLLVRPRFSQNDPNQITGFAVALPGNHTADGRPVWFGGGKLAADLSWVKLARRWSPTAETPLKPDATTRQTAWTRATRAATDGAATVQRLAATNPGAAGDAAHATGDVLAATARAVEGRHGGPLTDAAAAYDRAARELWGRTPARSIAGDGIRAAARALVLFGRASRDDGTQFLQLVTALIALTEAVVTLREAQGRTAQAAAARDAAKRLRTVAPQREPTLAVQRQPYATQQTARSR
jgi:hypothetical protein